MRTCPEFTTLPQINLRAVNFKSQSGSKTAGFLPPSCGREDVTKSVQCVDSQITSVETGLKVLAAAVSTMDATRDPPVYRTIVKNQRRFKGKEAHQRTMVPVKLQNLEKWRLACSHYAGRS